MNRPPRHGLPYTWVAELQRKDNNTYVWLITSDKRMYRSDDLTLLAINKLFTVMAWLCGKG
jgi:hypothetical protein